MMKDLYCSVPSRAADDLYPSEITMGAGWRNVPMMKSLHHRRASLLSRGRLRWGRARGAARQALSTLFAGKAPSGVANGSPGIWFLRPFSPDARLLVDDGGHLGWEQRVQRLEWFQWFQWFQWFERLQWHRGRVQLLPEQGLLRVPRPGGLRQVRRRVARSGNHCTSGCCLGNETGSACDVDGDCGSGNHCTSGECHANTGGSPCDVDGDCGAGSSCTGGKCN